ncbi:MAG: dehydrogenase [Litorilinea sp.]|nr:MAG: dehydrogenase [Litorilinea sp.]
MTLKRVGLVGTGAIARHHARQWQKLPVTLAGYYDVRPEAAQAFCDQFGGRAYPSLDALLADVDVVDICTPAVAHKECVLAAARAGVPMVCEKPLARHLQDAREMVEACDRARVPLFVAHVVRFFPQFARAHELVESGLIGRPGVVRTIRAGSFPRFGGSESGKIYGNFALSGGVILDVCIHDIDFQRWCCGEVERVFARGLTFAGHPERDHALLTLRFASGAIGHIEGSWAHPPGQFRTRLELAGDRGLIEWDSTQPQPIQAAQLDENGTVHRTTASPLAPEDDPYCAELAHFLHCLETGEPFRVSPHDALMAVQIALAAIASLRRGEPVEVATFQEDAP